MYSVIVPIYKVEKYLPQCIESILAQTHKDFELILVDDGSPDSCSAICDSYKAKDSRIKVIHKENGGLVSARKAGLEIASGDYICFVDGDDFILDNMLEVINSVIEREKCDILCAGYSKYYDEEHIIRERQEIVEGLYEKDDLMSRIYPRMLSSSVFFKFGVMPNLVTKCIKREILCDIYKTMPDNISLGEDAAVSYPALLKSDKVQFIDYSGYMYRQNPNSMTRTYDTKLYEKIRNLIVYLKEIEKTMGWQAGNQINEYAVYLLIIAKINEFKYNKSRTYRAKKKNMNRYLKDPIFMDALANIAISGVKNKFILFCFKKRFLLPIHLYESIVRARG
jgi:glycosyltransferase involved in cell wall biosynthesis